MTPERCRAWPFPLMCYPLLVPVFRSVHTFVSNLGGTIPFPFRTVGANGVYG